LSVRIVTFKCFSPDVQGATGANVGAFVGSGVGAGVGGGEGGGGPAGDEIVTEATPGVEVRSIELTVMVTILPVLPKFSIE
jgi:hypothetical protein